MARAGQSNLIEQHAEKGLLVLALAGLVFVVFKYVTQSPQEFQTPAAIERKVLAPQQIDGYLETQAKKIDRGMKSAPVVKKPIPDPTAEIEALQRVAFGGGNDPHKKLLDSDSYIDIASAVRRGRYIPPGVNPPIDLDDLEIDIAPSAPLVRLERELPQRPEPSDMAAHVAATFAWGDLKDKWDKILESTPIRPHLLVLRVEAEVRERTIGGLWGSAKAAPVTARPLMLSAGSERRVMRLPDDLPTIPQYEPDGSNLDEVKQAILLMSKLLPMIIEPGWYPFWHTASQSWVDWRAHLPITPISQEYAAKLGPGEEGPSRRPGTYRPPSGRMPGAEFEGYEGPMPVRRTPTPPVRRTPTRTPSRTTPKRATPSRRTSPPMMGLEGEMPVRPVKKKEPRTPSRKPPKEQVPLEEPPKVTPVPPLQQQIQEGKILIWFHQDTGLEFRKEYQFRLKLAFLSPLYMQEAHVANPADARVIRLWTKPSDWSKPVSVPQATECFVTGAMAQQKYVRVTVFAFCYGERVMKTFNVYAGQAIGEKQIMQVPNPALRWVPAGRTPTRNPTGDETGPPRTVEKEVDFSTGSIVVEIDFRKQYERSGLGPRKTVEILYTDYRNRLARRMLVKDQRSKRYRKLLAEVRRSQDAAKPKTRTP